MHNYNNNFILDSYNKNIKAREINGSQVTQSNNNGKSLPETAERTEISNVTPDYNVTVPTGYTKLGVKTLSNGQEIHCYKLNNGQKVYIAPKEGANTVLNTYVNTGALNEKDDERGISHFCEHMAFNGTKGTNGYIKLDNRDISAKVADMGGYTNASTNYAETNYTISIPQFKKEDFEEIVKMQASMMNNLEMSEEMTEKEHGPVTSEINMYADIPESIASNVAIKNLFNINTKSADVVAGTVENILNIDSKKVTDYYKNNYFPANMSTVVTGNVDPDETIEIIAKHFKGENPKNPDRRIEPLKVIDSPVRKDIISPKASATTGILCFSGPANNDAKGNMELLAINHLLFNKKHSILTKALEPYDVEVSANQEKIRTLANDNTLLTLTYSSTEDNSEIALKSVFDNIANFKTPTAEEMQTLKEGLKMSIERRYEDTERLNYMIGSNSLCGNIDEVTDAIKIIDSLTPQDITNAVHKFYDLNRVSIAVIHPDSTNTETLNKNHTNANKISFKGTKGIATNNVKQPINMNTVQRYTLSNNCDVALTDTKNNIASFSAFIVSQAPANTKPGVQDILEEMLMKSPDNIVKIVDKNNINSYTGASNKSMYFEADVPAQHISTAMMVMKQALFSPDFTEENFEKAKQNIRNAYSTMQPNAFDNIKKDLFPNSPRGHSKNEILNNLDNITLGDVMGLHKYLIDNGGFTFAASAPMEKFPAIKTILNNELSQLPTFAENRPKLFNDYEATKSSKVITDVSSTGQADVVQAYKFKTGGSLKESVALDMMNSILSKGETTGLFNNLREKEKLAYAVGSKVITGAYNSGVLYCRILTTTDSPDLKSYDNVKKSINGFTNQINKIKNGEFTDKEIESAKLNLKTSLLNSCDSQTGKVTTLSNGLTSLDGIDSVNKAYELIDTITREDIVNMAKNVFSNKPIYSVRATKDTLDANKNLFIDLEK